MFTGIVESTAKIIAKTASELTLERPKSFDDLKEGSSVSVSGACLSVIRFDASSMTFQVIPETWSKTKLRQLREGDPVNLERAMRADQRLDGHIVQGHVEGVAVVEPMEEKTIRFHLPPSLLSAVIPKGSITVDGVSLTVADIQEDLVTVMLIPLTLEQTTLGMLKSGDSVNIETDLFLRWIAHNSAKT